MLWITDPCDMFLTIMTDSLSATIEHARTKAGGTRSPTYGKPTFFLHPPDPIRQDVFPTLIENEVEFYTLNDHQMLRPLLRRYPCSIVFVNIDADIRGNEWLSFIKSIAVDDDMAHVLFGIVTHDAAAAVEREFSSEVTVSCGFIRLSRGLNQSSRAIMAQLHTHGAKGRRRYLRAKCEDVRQTGFSVKHRGEIRSGSIIDISSVGMAVRFDSPVRMEPNTRLRDVQLNLKGTITHISGIYRGVHRESKDLYVVLFDTHVDPASRRRIRSFVHNVLNEKLQQEIKRLRV